MAEALTAPALDEANAAFVMSGTMVSLASRNPANVPSVTRALGCRLSADRRRVTVLVAASQAGALLEDVAATGAIAAVFSQPSTHRTIQIKGSDARIEPATPGDSQGIEARAAALVADMTPLYTESFVRTVFAHDPADLVAVSFTPATAFEQTPGPQAGRRL